MVLVKNLNQTQINAIADNLQGEVITNTDAHKLMFNNGTAFTYLVYSDLTGGVSGLSSLSATSLTGTLQTAAQPNVTSLGTLTGLTVNNVLNVASHDGATTGLQLGGVLVTSTAEELNYVNVTTQGVAEAGKALVTDSNNSIVGLTNLETDNLTVNGTLVTSSAIELNYVDVTTLGVAQASKALVVDENKDIVGINTLEADYIKVNGTLVTSSAIELNYVDVTTLGTAEANKALVVDANRDIVNIHNLTADNLTGTLQTASQPNITHVGTLDTLSVTGEASVGSLTVAGVPLTAFNTGSLKLRVYSTPDFNGRVVKADTITTVDFTNYEPVTGLTENYSLEIWGYVKPLYTESYTFTVNSNDNFRMWINNELVRVAWDGGAHTNVQTSPIALTANVWYPIYIQHVQVDATEALKLSWSSTSQVSETIPTAAFAYDDKLINVCARTQFVQDSLKFYDSTNSNVSRVGVNTSGDLQLDAFSDLVNVVGHDGATKGLQLNGTLVTATATELNYTDTTVGTVEASKAIIVNATKDSAGMRNLSMTGSLGVGTASPAKQVEINSATGACLRLTYNSDGAADFTMGSDGNLTMKAAGLTTLIDATNSFDVAGHDGLTIGLKLAGVLVTATAAEINYVDTTAGTVVASKAVVVDANRDVSNINILGAHELNVDVLNAGNFAVDEMTTTGNVGINTTDLTFGLQVNEAAGNVLRLTYNDADAAPASHADFTIDDSSNLTLTAAGSFNIATHNGSTIGLKLAGTLITATATEINYNDTTAGTVEASKAVIVDANKDSTGIRNLTVTNLTGTLQTAAQTNVTTVGTLLGLTVNNDLDVAQHDGSTTGLKLGGTLVTATAAELNYLDTTAGTVEASKAVVVDANRDITNFGNISSTGKLGVNTTAPDLQLEVNSTTGDCLRLTYNDSNGSASNYADFTVSNAGALTVTAAGSLVSFAAANSVDIASHDGTSKGLKLAGVLVTATATEINYNDTTAGTVEASKAVIVDANKDTTGIRNLTIAGAGVVGTTLTVQSTTNATAVDAGGAFTVSGGGAFAKRVYIGQQLDVVGDTLLGANATITGPSFIIPVGDTASRPTGAEGQIRYNSETSQFEGFGAGASWGSLGGVTDVNQDTKILAETTAGANDDNLRFFNNGSESMRLTSTGLLGVGTSAPAKQVDINSATGDCLRLIYDDADGSAANYVDFSVSSGGNLTINASGNSILTSTSSSFDVASHDGSSKGLKLAGVLVTATAAEINTLDGITASTAELNLMDGVTATTTELNYVDTTAGTVEASKAVVVDANKDITGFRNLTATNLTGTLQTAAQPNVTSVGTLAGLVVNNDLDVAQHDGTTTGLKLGGTLVTSTAAELNYLDVNAIGTVQASKAVVVDASRNITNFGNISSTGTLGVNTTSPSKQLEINSATGACVRMTYDNNSGTATNYADFSVSSGGDLTIKSSGLTTLIDVTNSFDVAGHDGSTIGLKLAGVLVTATAAEINYVDTTAGTVAASKAVIVDANRDVSNINILGAHELNVDVLNAGNFAVDEMTTTGNVGINTTDLTFGLQVNEAAGNVLRLTYNDADAAPASHADFTIDDSSNLTLTTAGSFNIATHNGSTIGLKLAGTLITATATEINYNDTTVGTVEASKAVIVDANKDSTGIRNLTVTNLTGTLQTAAQTNVTTVGTLLGLTVNNDLDVAQHDGSTTGLKLSGTLVTATAAELNYVDCTAGTASASKALVLDASKNIVGINNIGVNSMSLTYDSAVANTVGVPLSITRTTSGTPANGLGVGMSFLVENSANANVEFGNVNILSSDITAASEDGQLVVNLMAGGTLTEAMRLDATTMYVTQLYETSDRRVKENIIEASLEETHERVMRLNLVDYNYIGDDKVHRGLIAQEAEEVIPVAVETSPKGDIVDFKSVSNREITNHLVGSVQFLSKKLDEAMAIIARLEAELARK